MLAVNEFLQEKTAAGVKPNSVRNYRDFLQRFEGYLGKPLETMSKEDLFRLIAWIRQTYTGGGITTAIRNLKSFLIWNHHPNTDLVKSPRMPHRVQTADLLSPEDIQSILEVTRNPMHRAIIALLADSAMRINETVTLKIKNFVVHPNGVTVIHVQHGKGDIFRVVPIRDSIPFLNPWLEVHPSKDHSEAWLFPSPTGQGHIDRSSVRQMLKRKARLAGIEKRVFPHLLRHTRLTHLLKKLGDSRIVRLIAGQRSPSSIIPYTHYNSQDSIDAIYPEFAKQNHVDPLLPTITHRLPDPTLKPRVFEAVMELLPEILEQLKKEEIPNDGDES